MGQREYDDFKLLVKEWKNSHPEEYRAFVEEIGTKSFRVYNKMIALASRYVSGFQKAVRKQILDSSCGSVDLSELVMLNFQVVWEQFGNNLKNKKELSD